MLMTSSRATALALLGVLAAAPTASAQSTSPARTTAQTTAQTTARAASPVGIDRSEFAQRRAALAAALTDGVILVLGGHEPREDYMSFYQTPNFLYLTGVREPDAALLGVKRDSTVSWTLFVQPKEPSREVWTGPRVGPDAAEARWGIPGRSMHAFGATLDSLLANASTMHVVADLGMPGRPTIDDEVIEGIKTKRPTLAVRSVASAMLKLRAYKSEAELALIRRATDITVQAHRDAARAVQNGGFEYEVQADVERVFRRNGAERPSFASIVGSGPNATTLHYNANNRQMKAGEMVVVDIGASFDGYAADMTRSYPVSGAFTPEQRAIYQIVRDAQAAAERQAKPGHRAQLMSDSASAALAAGLAKIGLIESADATYECAAGGTSTCRQLSLFYMHGLGHGIGLEVHDPDRYAYDGRTLEPGSVFTIEPGIYVRENLLDLVPKTARNAGLIERLQRLLPKYRNIGVRIEDDYIVTRTGLEWITKSPREIAEIEAAMKRVRM
jgi:Xaa-Pro aminopeptidase